MATITVKDGTTIFFKDWGTGQPIVFSHGWPLNADAWDQQLVFFASHGFRAIAHDRRGHGRSSQTWDGNHMNTYADDLAALIEKLELKDAVLVGHSTGGGEVARYIGRHGARCLAKAVFVGAVPPLMLKTPENPGGLPIAVFDEIRAGVASNRSQAYKDIALPFHGANRPGSKVPAGLLDQFWLQSMQAGLKPALDCIAQFSETDFSDDLRKIAIPTLFIHGDDDQIVPIGAAARMATKLVKGSLLKEYAGADHAIPATHADRFNADVLAFIKGL